MNGFEHVFRRRKRHRQGGIESLANVPQPSLASVLPGKRAQLKTFDPGLAQERRTQLQAYGLVPGRWVRVIQDWPVIVVQVEHTEIALENELASQIWVSGD